MFWDILESLNVDEALISYAKNEIKNASDETSKFLIKFNYEASLFFDEAEEISGKVLQQVIKNIKTFYNKETERIKSKIGPSLSKEEFEKIELIIHTSAVAAAASSLNSWNQGASILYDLSGVQAIQNGMIIKLGEIFGKKVNKSTTEAALASAFGSGFAVFGLKIVPQVIPISSTLINTFVSFGSTEILGCKFVELFYNEKDNPLKIDVEGLAATTYTRTIHTTSYHEDWRKIKGKGNSIIENAKKYMTTGSKSSLNKFEAKKVSKQLKEAIKNLDEDEQRIVLEELGYSTKTFENHEDCIITKLAMSIRQMLNCVFSSFPKR